MSNDLGVWCSESVAGGCLIAADCAGIASVFAARWDCVRRLGGLWRVSPSRRLASVAGLAIMAGFATTPVVAEPDPLAAPQVVVTPTRSAQTVDDALSSVTVITREDIERLQPLDLADLLRGQAGAGVVETGAFGKQTSVFLRGSNATHTLLIIDGVRMGSATAGLASFQYVPLDAIERVEIVRGPRTSVYGADAIGGVIQVFTRRGEQGFRPEARVGAGNRGQRRASAGVSGGNAATRYALSAGFDRAAGVDVLPGVPDDERDGFLNRSISLDVDQRVVGEWHVRAGLQVADGRTDFDGAFDPATFATVGGRSEFRHGAARIGVSGPLADFWRMEARLARSVDDSDNFAAGRFVSRFDTRRDQFDWLNHFDLGRSTRFTLGYEHRNDRVNSTTVFDQTRRRNDAVYGIVTTQAGPVDVEASVRRDDNEQFGGETTGQLALGTTFGDGVRGRVSIGTAFAAPSFNLLYFPGFSNPDLAPERSRSVELGLSQRVGAWRWDVALFETRVRDLIISPPPTFVPDNIDRARIRGLELETDYQQGPWRYGLAATVIDGENRGSGLNRGRELPRRSPGQLRLDVDRRVVFEGFKGQVGATLRGEARRFEDAGNQQRLPGYATLDLRGQWDFARDWALALRLTNLFDRDVQLARNFGGETFQQAGRTAFVELRWQPAETR
ncbi:MAG: TonB-dependent receptor domain-containing protein [Thioalkalivibrionaceae bacterium]